MGVSLTVRAACAIKGAMRKLIKHIQETNRRINRALLASYGERNRMVSYPREILAHLAQGGTVIHLGCGAKDLSAWLPEGQKELKATVWAVDLDADTLALNPTPPERKLLASGENIPLPDGIADFVFSEHGFEHFEHPAKVLAECARLLKPKGRLIAILPNGYAYHAIAARLIPYKLGQKYLRLIAERGKESKLDKYPTYYRFNDRPTIARLAEEAGFSLVNFEAYADAPEYTTALPTPLHLAFCAYHLALEKTEVLKPWIGMNFLIILEKRGVGE